MRRYIFMTSVVLFGVLFSAAVGAELYKWTDKEGVVHFADDILLVPSEYRDKVKVYESAPKGDQPSETPDRYPPKYEQPIQKKELYGGQDLRWWKKRFADKRREIIEVERTIGERRSYIKVFESGRRFGQTYSEEDVARYVRYKKELENLRGRHERLKEDLRELQRKATLYGVPNGIRE